MKYSFVFGRFTTPLPHFKNLTVLNLGENNSSHCARNAGSFHTILTVLTDDFLSVVYDITEVNFVRLNQDRSWDNGEDPNPLKIKPDHFRNEHPWQISRALFQSALHFETDHFLIISLHCSSSCLCTW